jgi:hypothetical protein
MTMQEPSAPVSGTGPRERIKPAERVRLRWSRTEASVWNDRMLTALRNVLEPIFEKDFAEQSYGFRPGGGCKDALRRVDQLLKQGSGTSWMPI